MNKKDIVLENGEGTLWKLIEIPVFDCELYHNEEEIEEQNATISVLHKDIFTEAGKEKYADVLNANVVKIYSNQGVVNFVLDNVKPRRLAQFSMAVEGYVSEKDFAMCFNGEKIMSLIKAKDDLVFKMEKTEHSM